MTPADPEQEVSTDAAWVRDQDDAAERRFVERHGHVNEIAVGTVLEYDDWQWALVSEIATDRDEEMFGFILLDELDDDVTLRLEKANGCKQHYEAVREFRDTGHEYWTSVEYVLEDDIWKVLGPIHPNFRENGGDESE